MAQEKDRKFRAFKLPQYERDLLRLIACGTSYETRHDALTALAQFVERLEIPHAETLERRSLRIGIPPELDKAIREKMKVTGRTYQDILLAAAADFRRVYPLPADFTPNEEEDE